MSTNNTNQRNKNLLKLAIDKNFIAKDETDQNTPNSSKGKTFDLPDSPFAPNSSKLEDPKSPSMLKMPLGSSQDHHKGH